MTRILLVEDDITMRTLLKTLLDLEGFETILIETNREDELIRNIEINQPATLLLDVHLRNSHGLEILRQIRQNPKTENMIVAMISGENLATECLSAGADHFFLKPFDTEALITWLRNSN